MPSLTHRTNKNLSGIEVAGQCVLSVDYGSEYMTYDDALRRLCDVDIPLHLPTNVVDTNPESISPTISETLSPSATSHHEVADHDTTLNTLKTTNATPPQTQPSLQSPIQLPPETLGEIFLHCLPYLGWPTLFYPPLSIAQVCFAWRRTALELPLLWANLAIETTPATRKRVTSQDVAEMIKLWFDRAKSRRLKFMLEFESLYDPDLENEDESITNALIPYTNSLQDLSLTATSICDIRTFVTLPPGTVNVLESLYLDIESFKDTDAQITIFQDAPYLRKVTINIGRYRRENVSIPWHQLTHLTIFGVAIDQYEWWCVLYECEQLISGTFSVIPGIQHIHTLLDSETHNLDHLVDLHLTLESNGKTEIAVPVPFDVLNSIILPALTNFTLVDEDLDLFDVDLTSFLQQAQCLRNLTLMVVFGSSVEFKSILRTASKVVNLQLDLTWLDMYPTIIKALTYKQDQPHTYLLLLENLCLYVGTLPPRKPYFDEEELVAMVHSRQDRTMSPPPVAYLNVQLRVDVHEAYVDSDLFDFFKVLQKARLNGQIDIDLQISDLVAGKPCY